MPHQHQDRDSGHNHTPQEQDCSLLCWLPDFFPAKEKRAYNSSSSSSRNSSGRSYEGHASADATKLQSTFVHNWSSSSSPAPAGASRQAPAPIVFSHINQMFLRLGVERDKVAASLLNTADADVAAVGDEHLTMLDSACLSQLKHLIDSRPGGGSTNETLEWVAKTTSVFLAHSEVLQLQGKLTEAVAKVLQGMERLNATAAAVLPRRLVMLRQRDLTLIVWGAQGGDFICVEDRLPEAAGACPDPKCLTHVLGEAGLAESGAPAAMVGSTSEQVSALLTPLAAFHRRLGCVAEFHLSHLSNSSPLLKNCFISFHPSLISSFTSALYLSAEDYLSAECALGVYIAITKVHTLLIVSLAPPRPTSHLISSPFHIPLPQVLPPGADADSARHLSHAYSLYAVALDRLGRQTESLLFDELAVNVAEL